MGYNAGEVIDALDKAKGNVSEAADILGCSRSTIYNARDEYKTVAERFEYWQQKRIDDAESLIGKCFEECFEMLKDDEVTTTQVREARKTAMAVLKTQGKERGWTERKEVTGADGEPVGGEPESVDQQIATNILSVLQDMSDDEKREEIDKLQSIEDELDGGEPES